jgi:hypothetical protein
MNCKKSKRLIYLYREGELAEKEELALGQHLDSCPSCRMEYNQITETAAKIEDLSKLEIKFEEENLYTEEIMKDLRSINIGNLESKRELNRRKILFQEPIWQIALTTVLILMLLFYGTIEYIDHNRILKLEKKAFATGSADNYNETGIYPNENLFTIIKNFYELISGDSEYMELPEGWVLIKINKLNELLDLYYEVYNYSSRAGDKFREELPILSRINPEDGLDENELKLIFENRELIRIELNKLLKLGGYEDEI